MWRDTAPNKVAEGGAVRAGGGAQAATSATGMGAIGFAIVASAIAVYAVASHLLMVYAAKAPWAVAVLFGPLLLTLFAAGWRRRHVPTLAASVALLALLSTVVARGGVTDVQRLYVLQHAGMHAALGLAFGLTLRPGSTALITALAERVHRQVTPAMRHYTRGLTLAWSLYFAAMIALSFAIYALVPWPVWSLFGNVASPLAAAAFFVGEHLLRYWRHPEFERLSMRGAIEAWRQGPTQADA